MSGSYRPAAVAIFDSFFPFFFFFVCTCVLLSYCVLAFHDSAQRLASSTAWLLSHFYLCYCDSPTLISTGGCKLETISDRRVGKPLSRSGPCILRPCTVWKHESSIHRDSGAFCNENTQHNATAAVTSFKAELDKQIERCYRRGGNSVKPMDLLQQKPCVCQISFT